VALILAVNARVRLISPLSRGMLKQPGAHNVVISRRNRESISDDARGSKEGWNLAEEPPQLVLYRPQNQRLMILKVLIFLQHGRPRAHLRPRYVYYKVAAMVTRPASMYTALKLALYFCVRCGRGEMTFRRNCGSPKEGEQCASHRW
jgi:hypothetical protein